MSCILLCHSLCVIPLVHIFCDIWVFHDWISKGYVWSIRQARQTWRERRNNASQYMCSLYKPEIHDYCYAVHFLLLHTKVLVLLYTFQVRSSALGSRRIERNKKRDSERSLDGNAIDWSSCGSRRSTCTTVISIPQSTIPNPTIPQPTVSRPTIPQSTVSHST